LRKYATAGLSSPDAHESGETSAATARA